MSRSLASSLGMDPQLEMESRTFMLQFVQFVGAKKRSKIAGGENGHPRNFLIFPSRALARLSLSMHSQRTRDFHPCLVSAERCRASRTALPARFLRQNSALVFARTEPYLQSWQCQKQPC